jgi:hypothetical protein
MHIRRLLAFSLPLALLALPLATIPAAAEADENIQITGAESLLFGPFTPVFKVNKLVRIPWSLVGGLPPGVPPTSTGFQETYGFHDSVQEAQVGALLQVDNRTNDFHTFTVVKKSDLPKDLNSAFNCFVSGPCSGPPPDTATIGKVGDGAFVAPYGSFTKKIVAPAGSVLYFMCIFHPEMQGKLIVQGDD